MIEFPFIQEIVAEAERSERVKAVVDYLAARFGKVTEAIATRLELVEEHEKLVRLTQQAAICTSLQGFEEELGKELPAPPPASTHGKRSRKPSTC